MENPAAPWWPPRPSNNSWGHDFNAFIMECPSGARHDAFTVPSFCSLAAITGWFSFSLYLLAISPRIPGSQFSCFKIWIGLFSFICCSASVTAFFVFALLWLFHCSSWFTRFSFASSSPKNSWTAVFTSPSLDAAFSRGAR